MKATERQTLSGMRGDARVFELDPPLEGHRYVVVSAVSAMRSGPELSGLETYIFPANKKGEIEDWGELEGSQRGTLSHEDVLRDIGYTIAGART